MIVEEFIEIFITSRNIKYYLEKGYDAKYKQHLIVSTIDLMDNSVYKILVECICGNKNRIKKSTYSKSVNCGGYYSCPICVYEKIKKTNQKKYGVDQTFQCKEFLEKRNKNNLEKYGYESTFQVEEIKEKIKQTNVDRYGFECCSKNKDVIKKMKNTNIERYGFENVCQHDDIKKRRVETLIEKYGESYGLFIYEKVKITCMEIYGEIYPTRNEDIKLKMKNIRLSKNLQTSDDKLSDMEIYKRKVKSVTLKNSYKLFENLDGYDYYDGEFILYNYNLHYKNKKYPSIDHKYSVYYGFHNNISPENIGSFENLCITKRHLNSSKREKTENEFRKFLENKKSH
jgi:hypothetical protein